MIKNSCSQGFAHAFLIIGLIAALIGALGFVFWQNFIYEEPVVTKTETQVVNKQPKVEKVDPNEGYTVVDNWGVRFKNVEALSDTEVKSFERTTNDVPPRAYYAFTTIRVQQLGGKCTDKTFGDTAILVRDTEKPRATPDGELINQMPINGYYYILSSPITSCSGFDENDNMKSPSQIETKDRLSLKESIKTLELAE